MTLADEAQLYLAVVDFFRAEGCEPQWRPEAPTSAPKRERRRRTETAELPRPTGGTL